MRYCERTGLPPLTVLVVQKDSGKPGEGFTTFEDLHGLRQLPGLAVQLPSGAWLAPPGPDQPSEADRLADTTISAIGDVLSLLRRLAELKKKLSE